MTSVPGRFDGKVAVVTGAASGIGAAISRRFVAEGGRVAGGDISTENLQSMEQELGEAFAGIRADVTVEDEVAAMAALAPERFGSLDVAFNVAGAARSGLVTELSEEDWDWTVDLVLRGVFLSTKHEARYMKEHGGGAIINVASLNAHVPMFFGSPYVAAKAGVELFSKNAALELAEYGVRVNAVLPGLVETPLTTAFFEHPEMKADFMESIALGRAAQPEEIAAPCLYLASDDASYVTGTSLVVDGGWEITAYPNLSKYMG